MGHARVQGMTWAVLLQPCLLLHLAWNLPFSLCMLHLPPYMQDLYGEKLMDAFTYRDPVKQKRRVRGTEKWDWGCPWEVCWGMRNGLQAHYDSNREQFVLDVGYANPLAVYR